jgi:hypothetical protein
LFKRLSLVSSLLLLFTIPIVVGTYDIAD